MVFRGTLDGQAASASLKDSSVSLAVGAGYVVAWDLGGRIYSVFRGGHTFRRGLSGRFLHKWRDPDASPDGASPYDERQRVLLPRVDGDRLLDESAALAGEVRAAIQRDPAAWPGEDGRGPGVELLDVLEACARFDAAAAREDEAAFARVYSPIGILPPDQYMSLVLQATSGCSFGTCTFCDLYHDPYRVKTREEFRAHVASVVGYLGRSLSLRQQSIFLGSANALAVPLPRLLDVFDVLHETGWGGGDAVSRSGPQGLRALEPRRDMASRRPREALPPVHAFVDGFTGALKDREAYRALRDRGLRKVYVGLESGHDPLLAFVRKPGTSGQALETVAAIKEAGLAVGLILMIGLGGDRFAEGHVRDTIAIVNAMRLGSADLLYFSDLVEMPDTPYPSVARHADVRALSLGERISQLRAIRSGLAFPGPPPKFARYDIREFVY